MKYLGFILTVIAVFLAVIATRLWYMTLAMENANKSTMFLITAQQGSVAALEKLGGDVQELRTQIKDISGKIVVK